jgi:hypothetical protein
MAKRAVGEKTSTINRSTASPARGLIDYCPDLDQWPRSWMGLEKDLPPGEKGKRPLFCRFMQVSVRESLRTATRECRDGRLVLACPHARTQGRRVAREGAFRPIIAC